MSFEVGDYDRRLLLVIDPILSYSTFLDFSAVEDAGIAVNATGNTYVTGQSNGDVYIAKLNPQGTAFLFTARLGGTGGSYTVTVSKTGLSFYPPSKTFAAIASDQSLNFTTARPAYQISGRITDPATGAGEGGVTVSLSGSYNWAVLQRSRDG